MDPYDEAVMVSDVLARSRLLADLISLLKEKGLLTSRDVTGLYNGVIAGLNDGFARQWESAEQRQARESTIELLRDELHTTLI